MYVCIYIYICGRSTVHSISQLLASSIHYQSTIVLLVYSISQALPPSLHLDPLALIHITQILVYSITYQSTTSVKYQSTTTRSLNPDPHALVQYYSNYLHTVLVISQLVVYSILVRSISQQLPASLHLDPLALIGVEALRHLHGLQVVVCLLDPHTVLVNYQHTVLVISQLLRIEAFVICTDCLSWSVYSTSNCPFDPHAV